MWSNIHILNIWLRVSHRIPSCFQREEAWDTVRISCPFWRDLQKSSICTWGSPFVLFSLFFLRFLVKIIGAKLLHGQLSPCNNKSRRWDSAFSSHPPQQSQSRCFHVTVLFSNHPFNLKLNSKAKSYFFLNVVHQTKQIWRLQIRKDCEQFQPHLETWFLKLANVANFRHRIGILVHRPLKSTLF